MDLRDHVVEEILAVLRRRPGAGRGLLGRKNPSHRDRDAGRVGEPKRMQAVKRAVGESGGGGLTLDDFERSHRLGMAPEELLQLGWIRFARRWIRRAGDHEFVEGFWGADQK